MAKKKKKTETDEEESSGKSKPKIVGAAIVGAVVVYKFVLAPSPAPADPAAAGTPATTTLAPEGEIFPLTEIVVNLADTDTSRYLRAGLALVLEQGVSSANMPTESAKATDAAIEYLSELTYQDLQEPGSKTLVREELSKRIRAAYDDSTVLRVLLTTFVMQ